MPVLDFQADDALRPTVDGQLVNADVVFFLGTQTRSLILLLHSFTYRLLHLFLGYLISDNGWRGARGARFGQVCIRRTVPTKCLDKAYEIIPGLW